MPLEDYYSGDAAFLQLARIEDLQLDAEIADWSDWERLVNLCGDDEELARVVFHHYRADAITWMQSRPPVLEGLSGEECIQSKAGLQRLKESLLRFPG